MNPETAKIIDWLVTSRDGLRKLDIADYAMIRDAREAMADAANALTNYAKTFSVIEQNDQAAAPHMLPAPEGVSEAEKRVQERMDEPHKMSGGILWTEVRIDDLETLLSALSEATERAGRMERERDRAEVALGAAHEDTCRAQAEATRLKEKLDEAGKVINSLVAWVQNNRCTHELTHRGGYLWTICSDCGAKWADDEGGKPEFKELPEVLAALRWTEEASQGEGE